MKLIFALLDDLEHLLDWIFEKPKAQEPMRKIPIKVKKRKTI